MFDDSFRTAWAHRYGTEPEFEFPEVAKLLSHRSVRSYAPEPISDEVASTLVAAAQSAATSSNLQLWSVISVQDPERRAKITELCDNQVQVQNAGLFFAFLADIHRLRKASHVHSDEPDALGFSEFFTMAIVDAALAAERMVCAAEAMGYGICYIGALRNDPQGVKELLELPEGTFGVFGLTIGRPAEPMIAEIKPRLAQEAVWFKETYNRDANTAEYDERMRSFYETQRMKGDVTWSMRSQRRILHSKIGRRGILKSWLEQQGFDLE